MDVEQFVLLTSSEASHFSEIQRTGPLPDVCLHAVGSCLQGSPTIIFIGPCDKSITHRTDMNLVYVTFGWVRRRVHRRVDPERNIRAGFSTPHEAAVVFHYGLDYFICQFELFRAVSDLNIRG